MSRPVVCGIPGRGTTPRYPSPQGSPHTNDAPRWQRQIVVPRELSLRSWSSFAFVFVFGGLLDLKNDDDDTSMIARSKARKTVKGSKTIQHQKCVGLSNSHSSLG